MASDAGASGTGAAGARGSAAGASVAIGPAVAESCASGSSFLYRLVFRAVGSVLWLTMSIPGIMYRSVPAATEQWWGGWLLLRAPGQIDTL